jgi:hypothetical protein
MDLPMFLGSEPLLYPSLTAEVVAFMRVGLGVLMLLTLARAIPLARWYFLGERWGGYGERGWRVELIQNPYVMPVVFAAWMAANAGLVIGRATVLSAAVNFAFCYYFFIAMRWRGVLRGMGAPGFIAYWLSAAVLFLEVTSRHAPSVQGLAIFVFQIDFALIMLAAGIYKFVAGYRQGEGMELGMVNPEWGYWGTFWSQWRPSHPIFRFFNEMAWGTEVFAALLMLYPPTRATGGLIMLLSFVFIASQIRLGWLCEMVMVCCAIYFMPGSLGEVVIRALLPDVVAPQVTPAPAAVVTALTIFLWAYVVLLPLARMGLSYNLLLKRALPAWLQPVLDLYTNVFGLILWRVFSADHTNFLINIYEARPDGSRRLISNWSDIFQYHSRFNQVAEGITVTTLFTTLKYYPSNQQIFRDRVLRYSRTVPIEPGSQLVFEYISVIKLADRFDQIRVAEFIVNVDRQTIEEITIDPTRSIRAAIAVSPVHEAARPGTYAPFKG